MDDERNMGNKAIFKDLPASLIQDMLYECPRVGKEIGASFNMINKNKNHLRAKLQRLKVIANEKQFISENLYPTTAGIDGAYAVERLLALDLITVAAVISEGIPPTEEKAIFNDVKHKAKVLSSEHNPHTNAFSKGLMSEMEMGIIEKARHDIIMMDGSLSTPIIAINQVLPRFNEMPRDLKGIFVDYLSESLEIYLNTLTKNPDESIIIGIPKYTSKGKITDCLGLSGFDDRALLTFLLLPGECTTPRQVDLDGSQQRLFEKAQISVKEKRLLQTCNRFMKDIYILYYKPHPWMPTITIEFSKNIADRASHIGIVLEAIKEQTIAPSIMEPYPTYIADRFVKHLNAALPVLKDVTSVDVVRNWKDEIKSNLILALHSYRSDIGR